MGELHDGLQDTEITVYSPDRSVTLRARGTPAKVTMSLAPGCLREHTEESLEYEIDTAVRLAMMAYRQTAHRLWRRAAGLTEED